jgi:hypothetical protein
MKQDTETTRLQQEVISAIRTQRRAVNHADHEGCVSFYFDGTHLLKEITGAEEYTHHFQSEQEFLDGLERCFWYKGSSLLERWNGIREQLYPPLRPTGKSIVKKEKS